MIAPTLSREKPIRTSGRRRFPLVWLNLGLAAALLAAFLLRVDLAELGRQIRDADPLWLIPAVAVNLVSHWIRALRHHYLLRPTKPAPVDTLLGGVLVASAVNDVLPVRAGELARVQLLARRLGVSRSTLAANLAAEVVLDTIVISAFLLVGILVLDLSLVLAVLASIILAASAGGLLLAWLVSRAARDGQAALESRLRFLPGRFREPAGAVLLRFEEGWRALWRLRDARPALLASAGVWLSEAAAMWFFGLAVGLDLSPVAYMTLVALVDIVTSLTFTPAGLGVFELSVSELLGQFGVSSGTAGAYVLLSHGLLVAAVLAAGTIAFVAMGVRPGELLYVRKTPAQPAREEHAG